MQLKKSNEELCALNSNHSAKKKFGLPERTPIRNQCCNGKNILHVVLVQLFYVTRFEMHLFRSF